MHVKTTCKKHGQFSGSILVLVVAQQQVVLVSISFSLDSIYISRGNSYVKMVGAIITADMQSVYIDLCDMDCQRGLIMWDDIFQLDYNNLIGLMYFTTYDDRTGVILIYKPCRYGITIRKFYPDNRTED